jgi:hypothetical protein
MAIRHCRRLFECLPLTRKTATVTITDEGRDKGKTFILTEMPADQAEAWATRALLALAKAGVDIPDDASDAGMAGIAQAGIGALAHLSYEQLEPLLAEMWQCVRYQHKPKAPLQEIISGENSQIEEVKTRVTLRKEVMRLHLGFSQDDSTPTSARPLRAAQA